VAAERSDVTYLGALDRTEMDRQRRAAAVVVATPTWNDVLPTVILEALAAGRPVLGTAVGGIPYLLGVATSPSSETAGWLVQPQAAALAAALPIARAEAERRGPLARARYLQFFHPDVLTARLIDIYTGLPANSDQPSR
jgi:glycosyltransferase involved in cell wall biosynthesis